MSTSRKEPDERGTDSEPEPNVSFDGSEEDEKVDEPDVENDDGDEESETDGEPPEPDVENDDGDEKAEADGEPPVANVDDENIVRATEEITEKVVELKVDTTTNNNGEGEKVPTKQTVTI